MSSCEPKSRYNLVFSKHKNVNIFESENPPLRIFDCSMIEDEFFENNGKISTSKVRAAYKHGFIDYNKAENLYIKWRDQRLDLWLDAYSVADGSFQGICFVKAPKRGNDVYQKMVKKKLSILENLPPIYFFDDDDADKRTPLLHEILTVDSKRYPLDDAWNLLVQEFNRCIQRQERLINKWLKEAGASDAYGKPLKTKATVFRGLESHESGMPHNHVLVNFSNWGFIVFPYLVDKGLSTEHIEYRLPDKYATELKKCWSMGTFKAQKILGVQDTQSLTQELCKYVTKDIFTDKGLKTCCMLWLHNKKAYTISQCNPYEQKLPAEIAAIQDLFKRDQATDAYLQEHLQQFANKDFIGSIWGTKIYLDYYDGKLDGCSSLAEPDAADLVTATMRNYANEYFFKFRGAILHADLRQFFKNLPNDWSFLMQPPPNIDGEMRFYFNIDSIGYDSKSDIEVD